MWNWCFHDFYVTFPIFWTSEMFLCRHAFVRACICETMHSRGGGACRCKSMHLWGQVYVKACICEGCIMMLHVSFDYHWLYFPFSGTYFMSRYKWERGTVQRLFPLFSLHPCLNGWKIDTGTCHNDFQNLGTDFIIVSVTTNLS